MLKGSPGPTLHTRRQAAPLAPGGLSPEPALRVPMDAPACPVAAHRPPDALYLSIGQVGLEQGHITAQFNLGWMYDFSRGVPRDDAEAGTWYRKAAEQGHIEAKNNLGVMYAEGRGVPQDYVEAHMWLNLAASRSSGSSRERTVATRDRVAEQMTPANLSDAQRRAREWHAMTRSRSTRGSN